MTHMRREGVQFCRKPPTFFEVVFVTDEDQEELLPWLREYRAGVYAVLIREQAIPTGRCRGTKL